MDRTALYRTVWRWHFYAGLLVLPLVLILSLTGAVYLFKPQVDRWEERAFQGLPMADAVSPDAQLRAALAAFPGARFHSYRLPGQPGDAALIHLGLADGHAMRDVFVSPQGKVAGSIDPRTRIMQVVNDIHGQLLLGPRGSWIVELAASWAIVLVLTGLYLWWPRGRGLAGVVWPRLGGGSRQFWRDLHAVTGFWVSGLVLVMLTTGLPWADAWGSMFKAVRTEMGWVNGEQDWTIGGRRAEADEHVPHAGHDHGTMMADPDMQMPTMAAHIHGMQPVTLTEVVSRGMGEQLAFPVIVTPPGAAPVWTVRSEAQNRPLRATVTYDAITGREVAREVFADKHVVDRVVGYGIAWHEGQLFGLFNQLVDVATALMLVTLTVSGFLLWRRRKPANVLGAPPLPDTPARMGGVVAILVLLAVLLPLLAASLIVVWLLEKLILTRNARLSRWLGLHSG